MALMAIAMLEMTLMAMVTCCEGDNHGNEKTTQIKTKMVMVMALVMTRMTMALVMMSMLAICANALNVSLQMWSTMNDRLKQSRKRETS